MLLLPLAAPNMDVGKHQRRRKGVVTADTQGTQQMSVTEGRRKKKERNLRARGTKTRIKGRYPPMRTTLMVRQTLSIRQIMLPFLLNSLRNANSRMMIQSMYFPPTHPRCHHRPCNHSHDFVSQHVARGMANLFEAVGENFLFT